jgi:orotate phosphoribosyltransferase
MMNGVVVNLVSDIFYNNFRDKYPFQLCALEIAGVPLATSLMAKLYYKGHEDINAFFIRKSRKKNWSDEDG